MSRYRYDAKTGSMRVFDERTGKWKPDRSRKNANRVVAPSVMPDIQPFVANASDKPQLITSRSQLGRYERSNGIRQAGDFKPGEIIERRKKKVARERADAIGAAPVAWTDFR